MQRSNHAQKITDRFRELVENSGDRLPAHHYDELSLLIESGIDAALVDYMEKMASQLNKFAAEVRKGAEFFE